jgi:hypothetical protein
MKALPYFRFDIPTTLTVEDARRLLSRNLFKPRPLGRYYRLPRRGYEGTFFEDGGFRITHVNSSWNQTLPFAPGPVVVYGHIDEYDGGARVRAFASFHPVLAAALIGFLLLISIAAWPRLTAAAASGHLARATATWLGSVAVFYLFWVGIFWFQATPARRFLSDLFVRFTRRPTSACSGARAAWVHR